MEKWSWGWVEDSEGQGKYQEEQAKQLLGQQARPQDQQTHQWIDRNHPTESKLNSPNLKVSTDIPPLLNMVVWQLPTPSITGLKKLSPTTNSPFKSSHLRAPTSSSWATLIPRSSLSCLKPHWLSTIHFLLRFATPATPVKALGTLQKDTANMPHAPIVMGEEPMDLKWRQAVNETGNIPTLIERIERINLARQNFQKAVSHVV
jgi:hypothetical protein